MYGDIAYCVTSVFTNVYRNHLFTEVVFGDRERYKKNDTKSLALGKQGREICCFTLDYNYIYR